MLGLLDFLSDPGFAAAAAQGGQGILRGQQQGYAIHQQQAMDAYRLSQLAALQQYHGQQIGIRAAGLQQRAQLPYLHALANPLMAGYFARNPGDRAAWEARAGLNPQVDPITLPPDPNFNPTTNTLHAPTGQVYNESGALSGPDGAPAAPASGPGAAPPPDYTGPNSQPAPFDFTAPSPDQPSISDRGLAGPRTYDTPFGPAPSTQLLPAPKVPSVLSGEPAGGLPAFTPPDTAGSAASPSTGATGGTGGTALVDPTQDPANPLYAGYLPHETDQGRAQRIGSAAKTLVAQIGASRFAAQYPGLVSDSALKGLRLAEEPYNFGAKMEGSAASTTLKAAQTKALQDYAPLRNSEILDRIRHVKTADELAALKVQLDSQYHDALVNLGQQRVNIAGAAQTSTAGVNAAKVQQINQAISQSAGSKDDATDRSILTSGLKALTSQKRTASGASVPFLSDADRATWQGRIDAALQRMQQRQSARGGGGAATAAPVVTAPAAPATRPQRGQPGYNAWLQSQSANPGTVMAQPKASAPATTPSPKAVRVSPEVQSIVGQLINSHQFDAEMAKPEYGDPSRRMLMKRAFLQVTGRNWTGGR